MNIIIIGASSGIGRDLAIEYWQQFFYKKDINKKQISDLNSLHLIARNKLALNDLKEELIMQSQSQKQDIDRKMPIIEVYGCDVSDRDAIISCLTEIINKYDNIDLIIYGSAIYRPNNFANFNLDLAKETIEINIGGLANCLSVLVPQLIKQKSGHLALIASVAGYRGLPNSAFYGASKAAMINLAETLYAELSCFNVKVSVINPGFVKTRLTDLNNFKMPCIISSRDAAKIIVKEINQNKFEIHFPKKFTIFLKLIRILPNFIFLKIVKKIAKNNLQN